MQVNQTGSTGTQGDSQDDQQSTQAPGAGAPGDPASATAQGMLLDPAGATQNGAATPPDQGGKQPKFGSQPVKVRVLRQCEHGQPNDVVSLAPREVKAAEKAGHVDSDPEAVAYAESLKTPGAAV